MVIVRPGRAGDRPRRPSPTTIGAMTGPRRLFLVALLVLLGLLIVKAQVGTIWAVPRAGVDLESPLRAADRWLAGAPPYNPEGFTAGPGVVQPFLYPPYTLPF